MKAKALRKHVKVVSKTQLMVELQDSTMEKKKDAMPVRIYSPVRLEMLGGVSIVLTRKSVLFQQNSRLYTLQVLLYVSANPRFSVSSHHSDMCFS